MLSPSMAGRIVFVVTEDWFFASHFLPLARAASEIGLDCTIVTRVRDHRGPIEATGARVVALQAERSSLSPAAAGYAAGCLAGVLKQIRPDIVHCIALRSILIGGAACAMAGIDRRVFALTGLGLLGARTDLVGRQAGRAVRHLLTNRPLRTPGTRYLFENTDDPGRLGLDADDRRLVTIVNGAGIDPDELRPAPLPPAPPLKVALVSRMLWSKGVDLAVEAVGRARARGVAVELSLVGAPDRSNRRAVPARTLRDWAGRDGVTWMGAVTDIAAVWREHHVACLPSRGGEGLPRALLEAAACGRAIVTTDVPGCRGLVRDGLEGFVVPPEDPDALAEAFARLATDPVLPPLMGAAARARVLDGFTERDVMDAAKRLYVDMLDGTTA